MVMGGSLVVHAKFYIWRIYYLYIIWRITRTARLVYICQYGKKLNSPEKLFFVIHLWPMFSILLTS